MKWQVKYSKQALKGIKKLSPQVLRFLYLLVREIELKGPNRGNWKNFGKLKGQTRMYHCHIKTGRPTYVVCWEVKDAKVKIIEVYYVGTHEKAPY